MSTVGAIILAAGASRRLGEPKQFLRHDHETLVHRSARAAGEVPLLPVVVVAGEAHPQVVVELQQLNVHVLHHSEWKRGIGSSIRAGLEGTLIIAPELQAVVISVCDQPFISAEILRSLVNAWEKAPDRIAATTYGETVGVPALFPRIFFPRLLSLPDHAGAKVILQEMRNAVIKIPFPMGEVDIDTPTDRQALQDYANQRGAGLRPISK